MRRSYFRYKGLGDELTRMSLGDYHGPEKRTLRRITLGDALEADQIFSLLMGEEVEARPPTG
jgi:DNA gyrase subunit B